MKRQLIELSRRYASGLREYLRKGPKASLLPARRLGGLAVGLGLETLDLARIHEEVIATVRTSGSPDAQVKRANIFFAEAIIPIENTHTAAVKADAHLKQVNKVLDRRTTVLAASRRSLKDSIVRRKAVEEALTKSGGHSEKLLEESRCLQKHLRHLTHKILTAQENKRKKISRDLQDEIAQTLLGINVRLLTLKKEADANARGFKKDIASTQRLVDKAAKTIKRYAREIRDHYEA